MNCKVITVKDLVNDEVFNILYPLSFDIEKFLNEHNLQEMEYQEDITAFNIRDNGEIQTNLAYLVKSNLVE